MSTWHRCETHLQSKSWPLLILHKDCNRDAGHQEALHFREVQPRKSFENVLETISQVDELLAVLEFAYNDTVQASTGRTAVFLNIGVHPRRPTTSA